jgi:flavin-dependent dehydrogenase
MPEAASPQTPASPPDCDVLVVGGGPAGSTAAALLARDGFRVVLVEKEHHPRFHIGESLLPANAPLFDALGLREQVERIGMPKYGVEFVSPQHAHRTQIDFAEAWDKSLPYAWQVRRSELDELMFRHAAACGAQAHEGCRVAAVAFDGDGATVDAVHEGGRPRRWRARYVLDATGRDTLLAARFGDKHKNPRHNSAALFGHFRGAQRLPGAKEGNISIFWFAHGWFWFIPLADGVTSVGAVCWPHYLKQRHQGEGRSLEQFFFDTIALSPALAERLAGATLEGGTVHATGNYSYSATRACGQRWALLGDAYAFIDPVFSSGVYLAMASAFRARELVAATLQQPAAAAATARRRYQRHMQRGPRMFSWFIYRMTNPAMRELFMHPSNVGRAKEAVMAVLAGDVFGKSPIGLSLAFFKAVYWIGSLAALPRSVAAWRMRRRLIRDDDPAPTATVLETR